MSKLNKEKRQWADGRQKNEEELQAAEDRANHLNRVKAKLEQNLDELEDSVEREKKVGAVYYSIHVLISSFFFDSYGKGENYCQEFVLFR